MYQNSTEILFVLLNFAKLNLSFYITGTLVVVVLIIISGMVSSSEVAFFSLSPKDKLNLSKNKSKSGKTAYKLLLKPEKLLGTILVTNNFVNVAIVILVTYLTGPLFSFIDSETIKVIVQLVIVTAILLLLGELLPKVYASKFPLKTALKLALPLNVASKIFSPVVYILVRSTSRVNKRMQRRHKQNISIDDLSHAIELASDELNEEKEMLEGIINFTNIEVKEIMKPRMDITAFEYSETFTKVLSVIVETGYSRIPVYKENPDNIVGVLYIKDLLPYIHIEDKKSFKWQKLIRTHLIIPETKKINDLLKDFQSKKMHMAVVVDEYGGTCGIVTMEDILEEIVGDINDESDTDGILFTQISENTWEFDGRTTIIDFCKTLDVDSNLFDAVRGESDSLAGLILEMKGDIPHKNENINYSRFTFTIESVDKRRIKKIRVTIHENK
ncbi:MAG: gliding motility-associated protein GldE [Bacteroidales bacterium]|nr:gliding motility-associated protein GldE [Bacteroidales bacterium]HQP04918.1 gliding motility-associated protein GldE [Bacteroidales bacterium]